MNDVNGVDRPARWRHAPVIALALLIATLASIVAGAAAERRAVHSALASMRTDAVLRAALLASEVARFRLLPLALAGDSDVAGALSGNVAAKRALDTKLEALAFDTGATVIYVLRPDGRAIAASNWRATTSFVGQEYGFRRYFREALLNGDAVQFSLGTVSGRPGLYLTRRTPGGGVIVVKLEFTRIERQWAGAPGTTLVENAEGIILVTSDPALRFAATQRLAPARVALLREDLRAGRALRLWTPRSPSLSVSVPAGVGSWQLVLTAPRRMMVGDIVWITRAIAGGTVLILAALFAALRARRRRRIRTRQYEQARTTELEAAVTARTAELRHEMEERQAIEARAATLREGLRQANRLATLGQVTASVAHETAQPVAAIRTYASNGVRLANMGETSAVLGNFEAIGRLADRIGAVTDQLRSFARKGERPSGPLLLSEALDGALLILRDRLRGITLQIDPFPTDLRILAERVRLEQVFVNLLQNAAEAMEGMVDPLIRLSIEPYDGDVRILVADNGPGIAPDVADRLFTPFTTSRSNGLGLGLVIAQDIAHDLGGTLRVAESDRGTCFALTLKRAS